MTPEESTTIEPEEYLYLYDYSIEDKTYNYFDYFKDRQDAEKCILFWTAGAPYIKTISLKECRYGGTWRNVYFPYKKSDYKKSRNWQE